MSFNLIQKLSKRPEVSSLWRFFMLFQYNWEILWVRRFKTVRSERIRHLVSFFKFLLHIRNFKTTPVSRKLELKFQTFLCKVCECSKRFEGSNIRMVQQQMQLISSWPLRQVLADLCLENVPNWTKSFESFLLLTILVIVCVTIWSWS